MKKKITVYAGIVLAFLVLSYAFVPQVLGGKIINQSDISGWQGMSHEMMEWNSAHPDDQTAWTGSMFGGMPTTTIHASTKGDWTQTLYDLLLTGKRPATYFFISLLGAFLLLLSLGVHPLIAAGGAVAVTFCSYNVQIIQVGHNTKMQALAFLPWVLAALIFTYRSATGSGSGDAVEGCCDKPRRWLLKTALGGALFGLAVSFQVKANHPQITYYLALMILLYALALLVSLLLKPERRAAVGRFFAASAILLVLGFVGIGTNAIKLMPTWEYTPYSMRGGSTASSDGTKATEGLDIDYATAWSYGWEELPNMLIPNYNGGSSAGAVNPKHSETYQLLKRAGQPNLKEICKNLPLYWGPQPFTAGPMYMGAITIFLFILGLCCIRGREKWWIIACSVLAVLLALGSHFLWFTRLFYDHVPLYNKFRTVSMALVVLQFTLPVLGFMALDRLVRGEGQKADWRRKVLVAGGVAAGLCLVFALMQGMFGSFSSASDAGQPDVLAAALASDRHHLLWADTWRSILLIAGAAALLLWGLHVPGSAKVSFASQGELGRGRRLTAALLVSLLVLVDLFAAGKRYLSADDFVTPKAFKGQFAQRPVDKMILEDKDPSYRVLDLSVNVFNDSHPSYWHKNIGGYSPAKLQRYQEYIDSHLLGEINSLYGAMKGAATVSEAEAALPYCEGLAALNCRYIILGAENPPLRYPYARGNAWFEDVPGIVSASECSAAGSGLPADGGNIDAAGLSPTPAVNGVCERIGNRIEMTSYAPNELRYRVSGTGGRVVFSEVYYPEGWTLKTESGEELAIECADGLFRSAVVPAGEHELVMRFEPASYSRGEAISRACSIVLILLVLLAAALAAQNAPFFSTPRPPFRGRI